MLSPAAAALAPYIRPGFRQKWLSATVIDRDGLRGWTPIISGGELVKWNGMILGEMSEKNVDIRETFFAQLSHPLPSLMPCQSWWCRLKRYVAREVRQARISVERCED